MGDMRYAYVILVGKPEKTRIDFSDIRWESVDRMHLVQDRDQWRACGHGNETSGSIEGG
jgi:hypothetical protein